MSKFNRRKILKILIENGWYEVRCTGGHQHFKHPTIKGTATLPTHCKDISKTVLKGLERQTGIKFL